MLVSVAISGGAISDLAETDFTGPFGKFVKDLIQGAAWITAFGSGAWYVSVSTAILERQYIDADIVSRGSKDIFLSTVVLGCVCIWMSASEVH